MNSKRFLTGWPENRPSVHERRKKSSSSSIATVLFYVRLNMNEVDLIIHDIIFVRHRENCEVKHSELFMSLRSPVGILIPERKRDPKLGWLDS